MRTVKDLLWNNVTVGVIYPILIGLICMYIHGRMKKWIESIVIETIHKNRVSIEELIREVPERRGTQQEIDKVE